MKISSKGRYGLAAMIHIAKKGNNGEFITIISIAEELKISKIYLEQVFSLLKRSNLVISVKGAQGGYQLSKSPEDITAREILEAIEVSLFETTDSTVSESANDIEKAMTELLWTKLDEEIAVTLGSVSLKDLVIEAKNHENDREDMYYI
ncbi:MAG: Rrf2 family transcriptional regulator [Clostridiales bacterium]|nr:Rrf2 family transcriptional regulator [Clostridiales bacterium]